MQKPPLLRSLIPEIGQCPVQSSQANNCFCCFCLFRGLGALFLCFFRLLVYSSFSYSFYLAYPLGRTVVQAVGNIGSTQKAMMRIIPRLFVNIHISNGLWLVARVFLAFLAFLASCCYIFFLLHCPFIPGCLLLQKKCTTVSACLSFLLWQRLLVLLYGEDQRSMTTF